MCFGTRGFKSHITQLLVGSKINLQQIRSSVVERLTADRVVAGSIPAESYRPENVFKRLISLLAQLDSALDF